MSLNLPTPISYLITSGATTSHSNPASKDFQHIIALVRAATKAGVSLIQLREKRCAFECCNLVHRPEHIRA